MNRRAVVLLYALGVLVLVGALQMSTLELGDARLASGDSAQLQQMALDAALSGTSYAAGYFDHLVHRVNRRERGPGGVDYPGSDVELWCGDRTALAIGTAAADPGPVRFAYADVRTPGAPAPKWHLSFVLQLSESLLRNRTFFGGLENQASPYAPPKYPEPPSRVLYRVRSVGEVHAHDTALNRPVAQPAARCEVRDAFHVAVRDVDPLSHAATFEARHLYSEVRRTRTGPAPAAVDPDGF
jgi:hypothetical protein